MVQTPPRISRQHLSDCLGHDFSESQFSWCLKQIKILEPQLGQFWQSNQSEAGIYLIITGKVRLIDANGERIGGKN